MTVFAPQRALLAPGTYAYFVNITLTAGLSAPSSGYENIGINFSALPGVSEVAAGAVPAQLYSTGPTVENFAVVLANSTKLGNFTINVEASAGPNVDKGSFTIDIVQYLVQEVTGTFFPAALTVPVGSTVYWMNLDSPSGNACSPAGYPDHDVVFTTLSGANSPLMYQYTIYQYTFTQPGTYFYYSMVDTDHLMNGTITVTG